MNPLLHRRATATLVALLTTVSKAAEKSLPDQGLRKKTSSSSHRRRRLQETPCVLMLKKILMKDYSEKEEVDCYDPSSGHFARITGPPGEDIEGQLLDEFHGGKIVSGESTFIQDGAYYDDETGTFNIFGLHNDSNEEDPPNRRRKLATGTKNMLAVRIIASDASTTASESEISDGWFGTNGDSVNLKSQYAACSYDKLQMNAANSGGISNGVTTVTISNTVSGTSDSVIREAALTALGSLATQFDYTMLCLPPGTSGDWIGYAYMNGSLSVYNDAWCGYVSIQMHEIGHNLNLDHSGEAAEYDDTSGMMGFSYEADDTPLMCFNAPKNAQLGWYSDRETDISSGWSGNLYGLADYSSTSAGDTVIAKISGTPDDWYFSFNRQTGINIGTQEGGDQVLVHKRPTGVDSQQSDLMAKLSAGQSYTGSPLTITVNSIDTSSSPGFASVSFSGATPVPTAAPTSSPTPVPTAAPTSSPTPAPTDTGPTPPLTASPTAAPTPPTTLSPTPVPTQAPTPFVPPPGCNDGSGTFNLDWSGAERDCTWLETNANKIDVRKNKYCGRDNVIPLCPLSCGYCACGADDPTYQFELLFNGSLKHCSWLTRNNDPVKKAYRIATYCSSNYKDGAVKYRCALSCGTCTPAPV